MCTRHARRVHLEDIGIEYERHGVTVDDNLLTTNPNVYAAGDVCMRWKFTHAADFAARITCLPLERSA